MQTQNHVGILAEVGGDPPRASAPVSRRGSESGGFGALRMLRLDAVLASRPGGAGKLDQRPVWGVCGVASIWQSQSGKMTYLNMFPCR